jgi:hypothetical protein
MKDQKMDIPVEGSLGLLALGYGRDFLIYGYFPQLKFATI